MMRLTDDQFDLVCKLAGVLDRAGYHDACAALEEVVGLENSEG